MDAVAEVATQVHFTRVRDLILERFPEYSLRHCWPAQGILVFSGGAGARGGPRVRWVRSYCPHSEVRATLPPHPLPESATHTRT